MPFLITDTDNGRGNIITGTGRLNEVEVVSALREHLTQDTIKFSNYMYSLIDLSGIDRLHVSTSIIRTIVDMCIIAAQNNNDSFGAVVAPKNYLYGFARMWEVFVNRSGWTTKVFRDVDEAKAWLRERVQARFDIDDLTFE